MPTPIFTSSAQVTFFQGIHFPEVQILVDNRELFDHLPGKQEPHNIKTLAAWPAFITAVLSEKQPAESVAYSVERHPTGVSVRETASQQLTIFDATTTANPNGYKARKRKVDKTLAKIRQLHDELNTELYANPTERPSILSPDDAFAILQPFLQSIEHEELWVLNLDTRNRVKSLTKLYQGSVNSSQVRVGEVFRQAIIDIAPKIVIAHNHPSGDPAPSPEDVALTRAIIQAGQLLDIDVLDHIVVGAGRYVSLKERGLGFS